MGMFRAMYSSKMSEEKGGPMSPRISFSNDFVESNPGRPVGFRPTREAPISTEFELSVSSSSVQLCADELFSNGRILPLKDRSLPLPPPHPSPSPTLRDELISVQSGNGDGPTLKPPLKGRWKGFLGLRRSHIPSKKPHSNAQKQETMREGGGTS
ncbi:hypothetical protein V2J09_016412 [Rumex salicifolius]